jgi:hypothetical protein
MMQNQPVNAYILSLAGGVLIILGSLLALLTPPRILPIFRLPTLLLTLSIARFIVGTVVGLLVIYLSLALRGSAVQSRVQSIGTVLLILAIIGLIVGGGVLSLLGFILTLVSSILALTWRP